jgi:hypothetical protein
LQTVSGGLISGTEVYSLPTKTREERERRKNLRHSIWEVSFAVFLFVAGLSVAALFPAPILVVPWGILCVLAVVLSSIIAFWTSYFTEHRSIKNKLAGTCLIVLISVAPAWVVLRSRWMSEKAATLEGELSLPNWHASVAVAQIGDAHNRLIVGNNHPDPIIGLFRDAGITVEYENGKILLSTFIRDQQGKLIATIDKNHWSVNPNRSICMDKNYTSDSLEVLDGRGHVVLQVRLYPDRLSVQGLWFNDKGIGVELVSTPEKGWRSLVLKPPRGTDDEILIPELFKYPSTKHWAEWK